MTEQNIQRNQLPVLISSFGSRIFNVNFTKRSSGENRKMNCRRGVSKDVKGVGMKYNPTDRGLIVVYEMPQCNYKCIPIDAIHRIVCKDIVYNII